MCKKNSPLFAIVTKSGTYVNQHVQAYICTRFGDFSLKMSAGVQLGRTRHKVSEICLHPPRHLLPHILQIMSSNPKYDQFQSKRHQNKEEHDQNDQKPQIWSVSLSQNSAKIWKINCYHILISSEYDQDTSACKFSGHFLNGSPGNAWNPQTWPVSLSQNSAKIRKNQDTITIIYSFLGVVTIHKQ